MSSLFGAKQSKLARKFPRSVSGRSASMLSGKGNNDLLTLIGGENYTGGISDVLSSTSIGRIAL